MSEFSFFKIVSFVRKDKQTKRQTENCCSKLLCGNKNTGSVYQHHFIDCVDSSRNHVYFRTRAGRMCEEVVAEGNCGISRNVVNEILKKPGGMWIGLFEPALFELDLKLSSLHKLHRIVTRASVALGPFL